MHRLLQCSGKSTFYNWDVKKRTFSCSPGCASILTSETTSLNSLQTSELFVGLKLTTSISFGIYLLPNYGKGNCSHNHKILDKDHLKYVTKKKWTWVWAEFLSSKSIMIHFFDKRSWNTSLCSETSVPKHKVHKVNCCIFNRFVNNSNFLRKLFLMRFAQVYQEQQNPISSFFLVPFIRKTTKFTY